MCVIKYFIFYLSFLSIPTNSLTSWTISFEVSFGELITLSKASFAALSVISSSDNFLWLSFDFSFASGSNLTTLYLIVIIIKNSFIEFFYIDIILLLFYIEFRYDDI